MHDLPVLARLRRVDHLARTLVPPQHAGIARLAAPPRKEDGPVEHDTVVANIDHGGIAGAQVGVVGVQVLGHAFDRTAARSRRQSGRRATTSSSSISPVGVKPARSYSASAATFDGS